MNLDHQKLKRNAACIPTTQTETLTLPIKDLPILFPICPLTWDLSTIIQTSTHRWIINQDTSKEGSQIRQTVGILHLMVSFNKVHRDHQIVDRCHPCKCPRITLLLS